MGTSGQQLHLRLFLEGIEVPVIAVQVQANINAPATSSIQVVPTDKILELKARTMVHVFFWDYTLDMGAIHKPDTSVDPSGQHDVQDEPDTSDPLKGYKLLFCGEVVGLSMMKTPVGRQAVLQCADFSTYWDTTYQFMITYGASGNFLTESSAVWAGGNSMFNDIADGHVQQMKDYLNSRPKTPGLEDVKGIMGGIISVLEAMGGIRNQQHGVNDFFTIAELKNHLMQQIVAEQDDDTAQRLFDEKAFMDWLNRGMSSLGQLTTFRDMMKLLFSYIYYECVPNPAPRYIPGQDRKFKTVAEPVFPVAVRNKLVDLLQRTSILSGTATFDTANVSTTNSGLADSGTNQDTTNQAGFNQRTQAADLRDELKPIRNTKNLITKVRDKVDLAISVLDTVAHAAQKYTDANLRVQFRAASDYIGEALEAGGVPRAERFRKVEQSKAKVDRLYTQIFRPDCFFAAPPKCNVFFPEMYTSFNFSKNFLQEVTRLRLTTGWVFGGEAEGLLSNHYFAPSTKDIQALAKKQGNNFVRGLLPWEKFSGILPKFDTCAEINYISGRSERKLGITNTKNASPANNYAQRAANFNYFKYRFASRGCDISMKFSPWVVCGFPAAIITQPFNPSEAQIGQAIEALVKEKGKQFTAQDVGDNIREVARFVGAPTHFLGMVAGISHSVTQDGGTTNVSLTHARSHRITEDDFMSVWLTEKTKDARKVLVSTVLDADELLQKGDHRLLQFLIDATDQSSVPTFTQRQQDENADDGSGIEVSDRPTGMPDVSTQTQLAPFALLNPILPGQSANTVVIVDGQVHNDDGSTSPLRGGVQDGVLKGTRTKILEPAPYSSKLKAGSKGPKGGKIVQIQCFGDGVVSVKGSEINKTTATAKKTKSNDPKARARSKVKDDTYLFMWRKIAIWEEKLDNSPITTTIPPEEAIRPPWFSPLYSNWFIGDKIYEPFFGCGSVVDAAVFTTPGGNAVVGTSRNKQTQLLADLKAADGNNSKIAQILNNARADDLADVPDVESSIDTLAYIYGQIRQMGLDVHRFVHDYVYRPIATMENMFGSADLSYSIGGDGDTGSGNASGKVSRTTQAQQSAFPSANQRLQVDKGTSGFHSAAIAPPPINKDLLGLVDDPDRELPRLRPQGKKYPIAKSLDPRPGRREAVQSYSDSLEGGTGSLGIGLLG